ncbi:MAG: DsbE family thiol:disulfide interchange protein [Pseudomonadota bacterium]
MRSRFAYLPAIVFFVLTGVFAYRLTLLGQGNMPDMIPSVMIGKPAPAFDLPPLLKNGQGLKTSGLKGKVTLVNFFASWCVSCRAEHSFLREMSGKGAVLAGIDYKDVPADGRRWLERHENPYDIVVVDREGRTGIDFGVTGVPESYLIDRRGVIRYKQQGPLTPEDIGTKILPLIAEMNK